ncbi:response regulator [Paenibacillus luteus]|uniref:response regulator n=1 Tax=Paenibacillus luteus TaxID=2545753 RepID=UPI001142330E|nr:response regulator [Paenibacillus luteus]
MYKVLLVDDERIILDGISQMVDWSYYRTSLTATARNGLEAYESIMAEEPDIVITDIRMPGMDGLELVAKTHQTHPHVRFIVLSGFREFEYASKAMQYGVKHYLLKPTNEIKIGGPLAEIVDELEADAKREAFVSGVKERLEKVMPHVKEQVLKEFVTNKMYGRRDWDYYRSLFQYSADKPVRLLLFQLEGDAQFEQLFAIKNIAQEIIGTTLLATTLGDHVLVLVEDPTDIIELNRKINDIRQTFRSYYKMDASIALSEPAPIFEARSLYQETLQCLNYRFYLDEGGLITRQDTAIMADGRLDQFHFDEDRLLMPVRSGHLKDAENALSEFFNRLKEAQLDIVKTKSYVIGQYVSLIRLADSRAVEDYYRNIPSIIEMNALHAIQAVLENAVRAITNARYEQNKVKYIAFVRQTIDIIEQYLGNADLSLTFVASKLLFINPEYLGKLFKKETGEKFTTYVLKLRIKQATEWIATDPDIKIFELAERLGYGDNPQYFSQVFKKYMGCTPSEYMKY